MSKWLLNTIGFAILAALGLFVWGGYCLYPHVTAMLDAARVPNLQPTLDAISGPRGTLHEANKAIVKIGDAIVTTQLQERKVTPATVETVKQLGTAAGKLGDAADALKGTANAGADSARALTETLGEGKRTIQAAQPLLEAYTRSGNDLDAMIQENRPSVKAVLVHVVGMTTSGDVILSNGATVTTKAKDDYMKANTPWGKITARLWGGYDMASWLARNAH